MTTDESPWIMNPDGSCSMKPASPKLLVRPEDPPLNPQPDAVQIGDQILVFRFTDNRLRDPRCVAQIGKQGNRCRRGIRHPDDDFHHSLKWQVPGTGGFIRIRVPDPRAEQLYVQQRCIRHVDRGGPDAASPTWSLFDPAVDWELIQYRAVGVWTPEGLKYIEPEKKQVPRARAGRVMDAVGELLRKAAATRVDPPCLTAVYRYYDADDLLLYIGITGDLAVREMSHIKDSSWMEFAARSTISRYPTRREAEQAEEAAIRAEGPLFNHRHNDSPEAAMRLVGYLIEHGRTDLLKPAVSRG